MPLIKLINGVAVQMTAEEEAAFEASRGPVVPQEVTMRQARLALLAAGKLTQVETAINAMPEPDKSAARIEWDYSNTVQRNNAFVALLGAALGMSGAELDSLFTTASTL